MIDGLFHDSGPWDVVLVQGAERHDLVVKMARQGGREPIDQRNDAVAVVVGDAVVDLGREDGQLFEPVREFLVLDDVLVHQALLAVLLEEREHECLFDAVVFVQEEDEQVDDEGKVGDVARLFDVARLEDDGVEGADEAVCNWGFGPWSDMRSPGGAEGIAHCVLCTHAISVAICSAWVSGLPLGDVNLISNASSCVLIDIHFLSLLAA